MKTIDTSKFKVGGKISYNDGRPGHEGVEATILDVDGRGMLVQFDDRARPDRIFFCKREWMDFITVCEDETYHGPISSPVWGGI